MSSELINLIIAGSTGLVLLLGFLLLRRYPLATLAGLGACLVVILSGTVWLAMVGPEQYGLKSSWNGIFLVATFLLLVFLVWRTLRYRRTGK